MTSTDELVKRLRDKWKHSEEDCYAAADAIERLTQERDEARKAALEEAAAWANKNEAERLLDWQAKWVASAIRALSEGPAMSARAADRCRFCEQGPCNLYCLGQLAPGPHYLSPAPGSAMSARRVRHKKRGTTYEVLGEAEAQISHPRGNRPLYEGDKLVIYRCEKTGKLWARFPDEFNDGRFEDQP